MDMNAVHDGDRDKASHHDTHALPPQFVLDAYRHYNIIRKADLDNDENVIDFARALSDAHKQIMVPVEVIPASTVRDVCEQYIRNFSMPQMTCDLDTSIQDVTIYEHADFPGLQIAPGLLPPQTQVAFVSEIMHTCLANHRHKTNLQSDYDLNYPDNLNEASSLFAYAPHDIRTRSKLDEGAPLNMSQYLSKRLRWLTIGAQYDWPTRSYSGQDPTQFPPTLAALVAGFFPHIRAESGVCLLYGGKHYMPVHRDVSEQCERALASFSFGCDGIFLVARGEEETDDPEERKRRVAVIRVHSGDCIHLTGESRWAWHAMARTISNTCPQHLVQWPLVGHGPAGGRPAFEQWKGFMGSKRLNVSCRQVWD